MELTKYAHACAIITKGNDRLIIDPGNYTELPDNLENIKVLVLTHAHQDHLDKTNVDKIIAANPDIVIFGTAEAATAITMVQVTVPETNQDYPAASFTVRFYGGLHALIHKNIPVIGNFGVSVDGAVYYPGDSFTPGPENVAILLAPAAAPWMKIGEAFDFVLSQKAKIVIPTHDAFMADSGKAMADTMLAKFTEQAGGQYRRLQPGESITI